VVRQGGTTQLASNEGAIVLAAEAAPRVELLLCVEGDRSACADLGPTRSDATPDVYAIVAGHYCITHVRCVDEAGATFEHDVPEDEMRCIDIEAGQLVYPGHLRFDRSERSGQVCAGRADFLPHESIDADLRAAYPALNRRPVVVSPHPR
jgi:hypothetical protein